MGAHHMTRRKFVAANWKMNGSLQGNAELLQGIKSGLDNPKCEILVCPPAPYLAQCQSLLTGTEIEWGAQDVSVHDSGAYTGEVSAAMLHDFGCRYAIVGHSERRAYHGETNELVVRKAQSALRHGLMPIVCVGETLAQHDAGQATQVVGAQLDAVLSQLDAVQLKHIVIAYEPIWAVGTGQTATPQFAQDMHAMIRAQLGKRNADAARTVRILYGGSVKPENAAQLFAMPDIDGGLIGGAALKARDFLAIIRAA